MYLDQLKHLNLDTMINTCTSLIKGITIFPNYVKLKYKSKAKSKVKVVNIPENFVWFGIVKALRIFY